MNVCKMGEPLSSPVVSSVCDSDGIALELNRSGPAANHVVCWYRRHRRRISLDRKGWARRGTA